LLCNSDEARVKLILRSRLVLEGIQFAATIMTNSLQSLFEAISRARNEQELRQDIIVKVGEYFFAQRSRLFFIDELPPLEANIPEIFKIALSIEHNPVLRYLVENHAPVHEELVLPPGVWKLICPRSDHGHVMVGPIVSNGRLIGGIGFTRLREAAAFNIRDIADLSALCLHLSTWLATKQSQSAEFNSLNINRLTPREIEIVELVAQGLTNAEIGEKLWIQENSVKQALKRIYRKLEVSSRTKMVALLAANTTIYPSIFTE
jgi:DNA-binding CsgD family transcriptional regulator